MPHMHGAIEERVAGWMWTHVVQGVRRDDPQHSQQEVSHVQEGCEGCESFLFVAAKYVTGMCGEDIGKMCICAIFFFAMNRAKIRNQIAKFLPKTVKPTSNLLF
jgi:hypothetical protein